MFLTAPSPDNYKAVEGSIEVMMHVLVHVDLESSLLYICTDNGVMRLVRIGKTGDWYRRFAIALLSAAVCRSRQSYSLD